MQIVTVIATKDFTTDSGHFVNAGQAVNLSPIEAAVRGRSQEVTLDPQARPTYRTRDMNAAPIAPPTPQTPQAEPSKTVRRRRVRRKFTS